MAQRNDSSNPPRRTVNNVTLNAEGLYGFVEAVAEADRALASESLDTTDNEG